jgi:histidine phosphotransferase ChpT
MTIRYPLPFVEQLTVRFCHDLAGPVGAVANGLELMEDLGEAADGTVFALVRQSAATVSHRLRYFRLAYGSIGSDKQTVGLGEIKPVIENYYAGEKLGFSWVLQPDIGGLPVPAAKLILNLLLAANACLLRSGQVILTLGQKDEHIIINVLAHGSGAVIPPHYEQVWEDSSNAAKAIDQRAVQAQQVKYLTQHYNAKLSCKTFVAGEPLPPEVLADIPSDFLQEDGSTVLLQIVVPADFS